MKRLVLAVLFLVPGMARAERYFLHDAGEFQPFGYGVEFYDRFGWRSYQVDFDFDLDIANLTLGRDSRLKLRIDKRGGGHWDYSCKTGGRRSLNANVNALYGQGISVVADCRIDNRSFAKAVAQLSDPRIARVLRQAARFRPRLAVRPGCPAAARGGAAAGARG